MNKPSKQELGNDIERDTNHRLGFMQGEFTVPDDFDQIGSVEIVRLFQAVNISTFGYRFNRDVANKR